MKRIVDQGPSLFDWLAVQDAQPVTSARRASGRKARATVSKPDDEPAVAMTASVEPAPATAPTPSPQRADIIDFLNRREDLPRFILCRPPPFFHLDRAIARKEGRLPPAPILRLPVRHPASPGWYSPEPTRRQG